MYINKISLTNWKNFGHVEVACGLRVFILGPNASGKSNFLDALRFLKDVSQQGLKKAVNLRGGLKSIRYVGARRPSHVAISIELTDVNTVWTYSLSFKGKGTEGPEIVEELVKKRNIEKAAADETEDATDGESVSINSSESVVLQRPDRNDKVDLPRLSQTALEQINANKDFRCISDFFSTIQYRHILPQLVREPKSFSPNPINNDPFGRDLVSSIWKTSEKTRNSRLRRINKALQVAVPNLEDLSVVQDATGTPHFKVNYKHWRKNGAFQDESAFSDGTLRLLALLWSLLETSGPLLLEEPELSLHEEIVARLPGMLIRADKDRKKGERQIFLTTHAKALLNDPGIGPGEVLLLTPNDNGVSVSPPSAEDREAMRDGSLTAADVLLPKTTPAGVESLGDY